MKNELKRLQSLFGVASPTVRLFEAQMKSLSPDVRREWEHLICRLAFGYYDNLPKRYEKFIRRYLSHSPDVYLNYLRLHSPMGAFCYPLLHPDLFLKMVHLLETSERKTKISYCHLASSILLAFDFRLKISTLSKYLRTYKHAPEEILKLIGKIEIYEDDMLD